MKIRGIEATSVDVPRAPQALTDSARGVTPSARFVAVVVRASEGLGVALDEAAIQDYRVDEERVS